MNSVGLVHGLLFRCVFGVKGKGGGKGKGAGVVQGGRRHTGEKQATARVRLAAS